MLMLIVSAVSLLVNQVRELKFHGGLDRRIRIAKSAIVHPSAMIFPESGYIEIGENSTVNEFCVIHGLGGVRIGSGVRIGCHTVIHTVHHRSKRLDIPIWRQGVYGKLVIIEDDVWVGAHCTILGGVRIGAHSVIGSHSLVTRDIPPYSIAYGVPAKARRSRKDNKGQKISS